MCISTVRQLSRMLGTILAAETKNSEQSHEWLHEILRTTPTVGDYPTLLNMTVDAIASAPDFPSSTPAVVRAWTDLAQENKLKTPHVLLGLVAVIQRSCIETMQDRLSKSQHGYSQETMDDSSSPVFNLKGDVHEINIKALNGDFSRAFMKALNRAQETHESEKRGAIIKGVNASLVRPEMTQIVLTVDHSFRKTNDVHFFNVASADFIQAYIAATFEYAAGAYADRVRSGRA
jgi:hypothetical protein